MSRPGSEFDEWKDAKVGNSTVFHARSGTEYSPSAYLFELEGSTSTVGYVTASARKDWAPILEYSTASPPTERIEATKSMMGQREGSLTGRKLYLGGTKYGLELAGGSRVGLRSGRIESISSKYDPRELQFDPETVEEQYEALTTGGPKETALDTYDSGWVSGVPAWTESDTGCQDSESDFTGTTWCVDPETTDHGTGMDAWHKWDGCVPIAASMVTGYHSGNAYPAYREWAIDQLHYHLNTTYSGYTDFWNIPGGIENHNSVYNCWNVTGWGDDDLEDEINNDRPLLLNMTLGGAPVDDPDDNYGNHTATVVGYGHYVVSGSQNKYVEIHDTLDSNVHLLNWGNWVASNLTIVRRP